MINQLKTIFLLGAISAILVALGAVMGGSWFWVAVVLAFVMNVGSYWFSDRIVLAISRAVPVDEVEAPRLHAIVADLARRADIPKPRVYRIPDAQPNAFATGRNPATGVVAVTDGLVRLLDERELRGVIAHEIAHIRNRDVLVSSIAAVMAAAISSVANMLQWSTILGGNDEDGPSPVAALAVAMVAPFAAMLIQFGISRQREYLADEWGARISGDPMALASALEKLHHGAALVPSHAAPATASLYIVNPFGGGRRLMQLFSTHPAVEVRVDRLRRMSVDPRFRS